VEVLSLAWHAESVTRHHPDSDAHAAALDTENAFVQEGVIDVDIRNGYRVS
jgi:hypothetical protein